MVLRETLFDAVECNLYFTVRGSGRAISWPGGVEKPGIGFDGGVVLVIMALVSQGSRHSG